MVTVCLVGAYATNKSTQRKGTFVFEVGTAIVYVVRRASDGAFDVRSALQCSYSGLKTDAMPLIGLNYLSQVATRVSVQTLLCVSMARGLS